MTSKKFDCVELKWKGAMRVRRLTRGMSVDEEPEFWNKRTAELLKIQAKLKKKGKTETDSLLDGLTPGGDG